MECFVSVIVNGTAPVAAKIIQTVDQVRIRLIS